MPSGNVLALADSRLGGVVGNSVTLSRLVQFQNAAPPILVTVAGIVTVSREEHPKKVSNQILVTPLGIVTACKLEQPSNAWFTMRSV